MKIDVERVRAGATQTLRVSNDLSVLGFRGKENLGDDNEAFFQIEMPVAVDTGGGGDFTRNTGVGLRGRYGQVLLGIWESPYRFVSVYAIDPFTAGVFASNSLMGNGFTTAANGIAPSSFDRRQKNLLQYSSPSYRGWSARIAISAHEEQNANTNPGMMAGLLAFEQQSLYLAYGVERHADYFAANTRDIGHKLGAAYTAGGTRVRAAWEYLRFEPTASTHLRRSAWQLAVTHNVGSHILRASFVLAQNARGNATTGVGGIGKPGAGSGASQVAFGYGYTLSKRTELWAAYTRIDNGKAASFNLSANPVTGLSAGQAPSALGFGTTHKF